MKKKFGLWLNIVTICLCVCAIAIGVYSATTANLNASGKLGFTAHGCDVDVSGTIVGHATGNTADGLPVTTPESLGATVEVRSNTQTLDLGSRYFTDMASTDGSAEDIVVTLTVTNKSKFDITAEMTGTTVAENTAISITATPESQIIAQNESATVTITLTLTSTASNIAMPSADNVSIAMEFNKYIAPLYYVENNKIFIDMGKDPDTQETIRWYAIAKDGNSLVENSFANESQVTAGTYVFISEYVLGSRTGSEAMAYDSENDLTYAGSDIQQYVNGTATNSLYTRYGLSDYEIYNKISLKTCEQESAFDEWGGPDKVSPEVKDQTLWLLSKTEFLTYFNCDESNASEYAKAYKIGDKSTSISWWLRSPYCICTDDENYYEKVYYVEKDCLIELEPSVDSCGVRPAFQITID